MRLRPPQIPQDTHSLPALSGGKGGEGQFHDHRRTVPMPGLHLHRTPHAGPGAAAKETLQGDPHAFAVPFGRDAGVQIPAQDLLGPIPQQGFRGGIPEGNAPLCIHHDDGIPSRRGDGGDQGLWGGIQWCGHQE